MIDDGLVDEVKSLLPYREYAALQTVGYKEIFAYLDHCAGKEYKAPVSGQHKNDGPVTTLDRAVELIQRNTRHYAKRQMSYWRRDKDIRWISV